MRPLLRAVSLLVLLSAPLRAQELVPLVRGGDLFAGEVVVQIESPVIDADRGWAALLGTFAIPSTTRRIVVDGAEVLAVGDVLGAPHARVAALLDVAGSPDNLAVLAVLDQMLPPLPASGRALLRNGQIVLLSGAPLAAAGLPLGTLCRRIHACGANARDSVVALVETADLQIVLVRFEFDASGVNIARTVELRAGQLLADGSLVTAFDAVEQGGFAHPVDADGDWIWIVTGDDGRQRLVTRERVLLAAGDPAPIPGRTILAVRPAPPSDHGHDRNALGGWAAVVRLSGPAASDALLVKNGAKLAQEGEVLPALAPYALAEIAGTSVRHSDSGHVYWVARTDGPLGGESALMRDREVLLRAGVARVEGELVSAFEGRHLELTPDGRYLTAVAQIGVDRVLLRLDLGAAVPLTGCTPNPGTLRVAGPVLTGRTLRLTLDGPAPLGALARVHTSLGEATPGNPCGIPTPSGELLISPTARLASLAGGLFANAPVELDVSIPADPALVDLELFAQGVFTAPGQVVRTNGLRFVIGAGE